MPSDEIQQARLFYRIQYLDRLHRIMMSPDCSEQVKKIFRPIISEGETLVLMIGILDREEFEESHNRWIDRYDAAWDKALDIHGRDLPQ